MGRARKSGGEGGDGGAGNGAATPRKPRRTKRVAKREEAARGAIAAPGARIARFDAAAPPPELAALAEAVEADGGAVLCAYCEPLSGRALLLVSLPLDRVDPTPYQRDVSPAHAERLADAIARTGLYLDPIIAFRDGGPGGDGGAHDGGGARYHTPNGGHRCEAMRKMGARAITALLVPDEKIAFRILALNTEKAHNLRERALEAIRMARSLAPLGGAESEYAPYLEDASLIPIGVCYERNGRFPGSAWHPIARRLLAFSERRLAETLPQHEHRADGLLALDEKVGEVVDTLKARGLQSPYLRNFVVARINPLRFARAARKKEAGAPEPKPPDWDATLEKMRRSLEKFDVERIQPHDLAQTGGYAGED